MLQPGLPIHQTCSCPGLLPAVVIFHQGRYTLVRQHLPDSVEALAVELESLLEEHLVLHAPLVGKRGEVGQVLQGPVQVVLVPEEHPQGLLRVVPVLLLSHLDEFVQLLPRDVIGGTPNEQGPLGTLLRSPITGVDERRRHSLIISPHPDPSFSLACKFEKWARIPPGGIQSIDEG